jgi:hypothetical protein
MEPISRRARIVAIAVLPDRAKRRILRVQRQATDAAAALRLKTGRLGPLPSFLIIGFGKCGTTEMYDRLLEHPNIHPALRKEVNFFMGRYVRGVDWYRAHFPMPPRDAGHEPFVVGEASPGYVINPFTPDRIRETIPDVKLVVLLRNPVARAYSHYNHMRRLGAEALNTFEAVLAAEPKRLDGEREKVYSDPYHQAFAWYTRSYVTQGFYADYLPQWLDAFPREQLLIVQSERFFREPTETLRSVTQFLDLPDWRPAEVHAHKAFSYPRMNPDTEARLQQIFAPHNEQLFDLLGIDYGWNEPRSADRRAIHVPGSAAQVAD